MNYEVEVSEQAEEDLASIFFIHPERTAFTN